MSNELELLGARKELLTARVSLQRLQVANEMGALRESLRWPRAAGLVASRPVLSILVAATLLILARRHVAKAAQWAGVAVALLRLVRGFAQSR